MIINCIFHLNYATLLCYQAILFCSKHSIYDLRIQQNLTLITKHGLIFYRVVSSSDLIEHVSGGLFQIHLTASISMSASSSFVFPVDAMWNAVEQA